MKKIIPIVCVILLSSVYVHGFSKNSEYNPIYNFNSDSLVIKKNGSDKEVVLFVGNTLKVWKYDDRKSAKGIFKKFENGSLIIVTKKQTPVSIPVQDIKKIKLLKEKRTIPTVITVIGYTAMIGGVGAVCIGTIALLVGNTAILGYGALSYGVGTIITITGHALSGKVLNLEKKWSIQTN